MEINDIKVLIAFSVILLTGGRIATAEDTVQTDEDRPAIRLLPTWIHVGGEARERLESLAGLSFQSADNRYLLQRLRMDVKATPLPWLTIVLQAQDSRVFFTRVSPAPASQMDAFDLRLAYLRIGDSESSRVSLRVGRQDATFGEGRLLADPKWSNVGRTFTGARAVFRFGPVRLDAITGATDRVYIHAMDTPVPGQHLHGFYGTVRNVVPRASIEPYWFLRLEQTAAGELTRPGKLTTSTAGLLWTGKLSHGLDYGSETVLQRGSIAGEPVSAWAAHFVAGYTAPVARRPRTFLELNRASGDHDGRDGRHGSFDPLFPSSHDRFGLADQFGWTNIVHVRTGVQVQMHRTVTVGAAYNSFHLVDSHDGVYCGGKLLVRSDGRAGTHIGRELDVQGQWTRGRHTVVDAGYGRILPGKVLTFAGRNTPYHCFFLGVTHRL